MNLLLTLMLCASAAVVDGKGDDSAILESLSTDAPVELPQKQYKDTIRFRGNTSTGSRDDGVVVKRQAEEEELDAWMDSLEFESRGNGRHLSTGSRDDGHAITDPDYLDDDFEDESYGIDWEFQDMGDSGKYNFDLGVEMTAQLERHLKEQVLQENSRPKVVNRGILKGQSNNEIEEEEVDEDEYDEVMLPESRILGKAGKGARRYRGKAKKKNGKKNGKKKGKKGNKKGKYKIKKNKNKKQAGMYKNGNNYNSGEGYYDSNGVFIFGTNGVVGNTIHNNLFNDNNRRAVCIQPSDPYRTCFQRAKDPNNKLNKSYIDRSGYNFGVKLYRQGYTYVRPNYVDPAYNTPLEPYSKPYTTSNEKLYSSTMWLTLLQDNTNVNCAAEIDIEEATLKYLYDNVGSPNTYEPVCVHVTNSAYDKQDILDGSGDTIESTVLALEITYVMKDSFINQRNRELEMNEQAEEAITNEGVKHDEDVNDNEDRELAGRRCRPQDRALCSSQFAINSRPSQSCKNKGCRSGRPRPGGNRMRNANNFNNVVKATTPFNPAQTNALLDMQDIDYVASCSTNRYAKEMEQTFTLTCTQFDDYGCQTENDDLTPMLTERNGCASDSYFPTVFPSGVFPTSYPTSFPTIFPSITPTSIPTVSPTFHPTLTPSLVPTITPSMIPTITPSSIPTVSPSLHPTHLPTLSPTLEPTSESLGTNKGKLDPTLIPTLHPTLSPSEIPTLSPTITPSVIPTLNPTISPSIIPSPTPTLSPTFSPSMMPTLSPTLSPTFSPTVSPTLSPTLSPTINPTTKPTSRPASNKLFKNEQKKKEKETKLFKKKAPRTNL